MTTQRINLRGRAKEDVLEELLMLGYEASIDGDDVVVYLGSKGRRNHKPHNDHKPAKWTKRERNFGWTRGRE